VCTSGVGGGRCANAAGACLAFSGPDMGGPDMGGPDIGGPDMGGPDMSGPEACACRPAFEACAFSATAAMCGGLCPDPSDACFFLSGPDMGGPDMGGPDIGGPDMGGPDMGGPDTSAADCTCRPKSSACGSAQAPCGGLCAKPNELCLSLSGPDMGGPDISGPEAGCGCTP
jgi:hypothetical protein